MEPRIGLGGDGAGANGHWQRVAHRIVSVVGATISIGTIAIEGSSGKWSHEIGFGFGFSFAAIRRNG